MHLLQRIFLTRTLPSSSILRRSLTVYKLPLLARRIHTSKSLYHKGDKKDDESEYDAVLRNIILQSSFDGIKSGNFRTSAEITREQEEIKRKEEEEGEGKKEVEEKGGGGGNEEPTNLLITLDALGTLYEIKDGDLGKQYTLVAEECGLEGLDSGDVARSFKDAFKELSSSHPNYGYHTGLTPKEWWELIAVKTFTPLLPPEVALPKNLASSLWTHFSSDSAYSIIPGTLPFLWNIKDLKDLAVKTILAEADWKFRTVTIGIISNSDDRIVDVLGSMGITAIHLIISQDGEFKRKRRSKLTPKNQGRQLVKSLKGTGALSGKMRKSLWKSAKSKTELIGGDQIVDFVVTSCKLGVAKPQKEIFEAARNAAKSVVKLKHGDYQAGKGWEWYHVGDDREEDVVGAFEAGGVGILFDRNKEIGETERIVEASEEGLGYKTMVVGDLREVAEFTEGLSYLYEAGGQKVEYSFRSQPRDMPV
ncbi:hypothetical protein TWF506_000756 [Arthrobotrys conoides]|uniref:Uncharacterized protein n=1 Tax=Arthrobotrys conoides TaxID=74498 RepID=A0AAN8NRR3_9PEZI